MRYTEHTRIMATFGRKKEANEWINEKRDDGYTLSAPSKLKTGFYLVVAEQTLTIVTEQL